MPNAITLRLDFTASALRSLARRSKEAVQARRLLSLAVIYDGGRRSEAARLGNVTLQIVRDRVVRFNTEGPDGLRDRTAPGAAAERSASRCASGDHRARPDTGHSWRGALADRRSRPMAVGGVPGLGLAADA